MPPVAKNKKKTQAQQDADEAEDQQDQGDDEDQEDEEDMTPEQKREAAFRKVLASRKKK